jgi:hypothetical protein
VLLEILTGRLAGLFFKCPVESRPGVEPRLVGKLGYVQMTEAEVFFLSDKLPDAMGI